MKASFCRIPWILLSAFLAACGGGGGGGGGSPQGPTGAGGPPSVPPANYQGANGPADLNSATAGAMAEALYLSFFVPLDLSDEFIAALPPAGQSVDEVQSGPNGGSVHVTGRTNTDGTGWIAGRFTGYRDGDTTVDGLQVAETVQLASPANGQRQRQRISFGDLRVRAADVDVTYGGSITRTDSGVTQERNVDGTLLIRDNLGGQTFYTQDVDLTRTVAPTGDFALSGTARAFDSRYGYLDVESEGPWNFRLNEEFPHHGAAFRGVGLDGRYLRLSPLTPDLASIEYVGAGATQPNFAARVLWPESFELQTTRPLLGAPVADGGASSFQRPGTIVVLDSRFTTHPQTAFVSSHWTLLFRPPGSAAVVEGSQLTRTQITLDVEGRYVIALEVSDGARTDRDVIVLTADANVSTLFTAVNAQLTPDESVSTGGSLALDLSQTQYTSFDEPLPQLTLSGMAPTGFSAFITQTNPKSATLELNGTGVYELVWSQGSLSMSDALVRDLKYVALNSPMPFAPGGAAYLGAGDPGAVASGDLNADGFADLVVTMRDNSGNALMHLLYGNAAGMLEPAVTLPVSQVGSVAIGDVNSDGLADIVMTTGLGIGVLLQGPLATFGGELSVPGNCFIGSGERDFAVADLNGDHRLDVVSQGCFGELDYYLQSATEGLQAPVRVTTGISSQARLAVGDLNGDAVADVVLSEQSFANAPSIFAVYGVGGALPGAPVPLPYQSAFVHKFASAVALTDVNRDGRLDVVTGENPLSTGVNPRVMTFLQQANGSFAAPIFTSSGPSGTLQIAALDLNRDGAIDIATFGGFPGLNVLYGGPFFGGLTVDPRPSATLASKYAFPEAVLDLNHDGLLDFAYLTGDGRRVILGVALGWDD